MQELIARPEAYFYDVDMQKSPEDVVKDCQWFIEKLTWGLRPHNPRRAAFVFVRSTGEVNPLTRAFALAAERSCASLASTALRFCKQRHAALTRLRRAPRIRAVIVPYGQ